LTAPKGRSGTQARSGGQATGPGRAWSTITGIFSGVPAEAESDPGREARPPDEEAFATRLSNEISRHPTRLVAACLASVLGPAMVAHAGSSGLSSASTVEAATEAVVDEAPLAPPTPGDLPTWEAAARVAADTCPGLPAPILVAIAQVESSLGLQSWPSAAGAEGPMQFLPRTWAAYATDGDGDGRADVSNPTDALHGAARLLCANGAGDGRLRSALWNYNHSHDYVEQVLSVAAG
jgi:hypothetical protein